MSEHTPGPWHGEGQQTWIGNNHFHVVGPPGGLGVALAWFRKDGNDPEGRANARLIAASPTMYSICERLADTTNMETVYSLQEEARAIISKKEETDV